MTFEQALALIKYPSGVLPGTERYLKNTADGESSVVARDQKDEANKRNRSERRTATIESGFMTDQKYIMPSKVGEIRL